MSVPVEEKIPSVSPNGTRAVAQNQVRTGFQRWLRGPEPDLRLPLGKLRWMLALSSGGCALLAALLVSRVIDFGSMNAGWMISFPVNMTIGILLLLLMLYNIGVKAFKRPRTDAWRSRNSLISSILLLALAGFFLLGAGHLGPLHGIDLGIFTYTVQAVDINLLLVLVLVMLLACLALMRSALAGVTLLVGFVWWGCSIDGFGWQSFVDLFTSPSGGRFLQDMVPPDWSYFGNVINPLLLTIQTAVLATLIGVVGALPLSILAARNTTPHPVIYNVVRSIINTLRAIPSLILAMVCITFVGLGPVAGAFGLGIHSLAVLTKLFAEAIESVKVQPIEALRATGANGLKIFRWGIIPQAFPLLISSSIYYWESNVRDSTVVAFVGGGGIGFILQANLSLFEYAHVSVIIASLVLVVILLDRVSDYIRSKIL
ncbi:phosphonate ABC transporter, permease protein PhnE [Ktedonospora formicarum]|uniref:ABC transmembrane type-1 domain-containing protein n=1 Tax=Ktedonospora formicarum TaxID=2778364 RepID=A0A8J3HWH7_9CHLR|nr:phosphonate ABC transporter, permease protein PhnE [Ktedonospora formicarum]GHO41962.1 hypothetical protein KSX_01250 [Ktedonospora formicarum]